ncbi:hypothetical protein MBLNU459_g3855t1 [Dothideomycetes sp. NU459]
MTRATQTVSIGLLVSSVRHAPRQARKQRTSVLIDPRPQLYLACFLGLIPFGATIQDEIIPVLPFWALVSFGAYLLFKLGWGVFTFNDVPQAHKELMAEIELARADLRKKGVEVD